MQKVKIFIGLELGLEPEEVFLEFKELPTIDALKMKRLQSSKDELKMLEFWRETFPKVLVDHNLYIDEQKKMTADEVIGFVFEKLDLTGKVLMEYTNANFFTQRKKTEDK